MVIKALVVASLRALPALGTEWALEGELENDLINSPLWGQMWLETIDMSGAASVDSPLFVACNVNNWNPADPAWKMNFDGERWVLKIPQSTSQRRMEFKLTRGSWNSVEVDEAMCEAPNHRIGFAAPGTPAP